MPDDIRFLEKDGIVKVVSTGVVAGEEMENTKKRLQRFYDEKAVCRVLVDITGLASVPGLADIFEAMASPHLLEWRIAFLTTASIPIKKDVAFAETVGLNRGKTVKVFEDEGAARRWLLSEEW